MPSKTTLLTERYAVMKAHCVPRAVRQASHGSSLKFAEAMRAVGEDPNKWPHLMRTSRGYREHYSMSEDAIRRRADRVKLKEAGLDAVRCDHWCRNTASTEYALRALEAGRELPLRPGLLRKAAKAAGAPLLPSKRPLSTAARAVAERERAAQLRAAGLEWNRTRIWAKGASATEYALRAIAAGRIDSLPLRPGMLRKSQEVVLAVVAVLMLSVNGWGCAAWPNDPPANYVIDSEFPDEQREVIRDAFDAWCNKVGYCPEEALWADRGRVMLVDDLPENEYTEKHCPPDRECQTNGKSSGGDNVLVARKRAAPGDMDVLWHTVAHEIGHYCTEHTKGGLMAATGDGDHPILEIDDEAARAWERGCDWR